MNNIAFHSLSTLCTVILLTLTESSNYTDNGFEKMAFHLPIASAEVAVDGIDRTNIDFDRDLNATCDKLRALDVIITNTSEALPVHGGEQMMETLKAYNQACLDLLFLCNIDKLKALSTAEDILTPGGPRFLDIAINKREAGERFEWGEDKVNELDALLKKSYELWGNLWHIFNTYAQDMFNQ